MKKKMTREPVDSRRIHQSLTHREKEVLILIANEYSTNEIAKILFISSHTAISHRKRLLSKLGVRNTAGLVRRAFEAQILKFSKAWEVHAA